MEKKTNTADNEIYVMEHHRVYYTNVEIETLLDGNTFSSLLLAIGRSLEQLGASRYLNFCLTHFKCTFQYLLTLARILIYVQKIELTLILKCIT